MSTAGPRIRTIKIQNYRSIGDESVTIAIPSGSPLVLIGENNAGKSNVLRALLLVLGEVWPGNHVPEDHEIFGRSPADVEVRIELSTAGVQCPKCFDSEIQKVAWKYCQEDERPCEFTYHANNCDHSYMSNDVRAQLTCMSVGVDRDLAYQLSYTSKWTTLSKLMRRFHAHLVGDESRVEKLKDFYDRLVETFYQVDEFKGFADALRDATIEFGGNLPYGLDIDFSAYDASNFFRSLRIVPQVDGHARSYEEMGSGQEQVLAMAFSYAYAKAFGGAGLILAVEEPETHLHPLAQHWVADRLKDLAAEGVQVIVTTHSPAFVDLSRPGTAVIVRKDSEDASTVVTQLPPRRLVKKLVDLGAPDGRVTESNVGPFYEVAATDEIKEGLFARGCVLVEGPTEALSLPVLLTRVGLDTVKLGLSFVPVQGVTNLAKWTRYFSVHGIPVFPVLDTDSGKTGHDAEKAAIARKDLFRALDRSIIDWSDAVQGPIGIDQQFAVFDENYELAMEATFGDHYRQLQNKAEEILGSAKPLVGRYIASNLRGSDELPTEWEPLNELATAIKALVAAD